MGGEGVWSTGNAWIETFCHKQTAWSSVDFFGTNTSWSFGLSCHSIFFDWWRTKPWTCRFIYLNVILPCGHTIHSYYPFRSRVGYIRWFVIIYLLIFCMNCKCNFVTILSYRILYNIVYPCTWTCILYAKLLNILYYSI